MGVLPCFPGCCDARSAAASLARACRTATGNRCAWPSCHEIRYCSGHCRRTRRTEQVSQPCATGTNSLISTGPKSRSRHEPLPFSRTPPLPRAAEIQDCNALPAFASRYGQLRSESKDRFGFKAAVAAAEKETVGAREGSSVLPLGRAGSNAVAASRLQQSKLTLEPLIHTAPPRRRRLPTA